MTDIKEVSKWDKYEDIISVWLLVMQYDNSKDIILRVIKIIKSIRLASGMSHDELARKSGVTRPAISHIESGKRKPSLQLSLRIADALGHKLSEIIRKAEEQDK